MVGLIGKPDFFEPEVDHGVGIFGGDAVTGGDESKEPANGEGVVAGRGVGSESDGAGGIFVAGLGFAAHDVDGAGGEGLE